MPDGGSADEPPPPPKKHRGDLTLDGDHLRRQELQLDNLDRLLYTVHPPRSRAPPRLRRPRVAGGEGAGGSTEEGDLPSKSPGQLYHGERGRGERITTGTMKCQYLLRDLLLLPVATHGHVSSGLYNHRSGLQSDLILLVELLR